MARNKGTFPFAANFEVKAASPLDPRVLVEKKSELISKDTWPLDGDTLYIYKGLLVSVQEEKAIYMLVDPDKILETDYSGWERKDGSSPGEVSYEDIYIIEGLTAHDIEIYVEGPLRMDGRNLSEAIDSNKRVYIKYSNSAGAGIIPCSAYREDLYYVSFRLNSFLYGFDFDADSQYIDETSMFYIDIQEKLESGKNIKTINGQSILGNGNLVIENIGGGGSVDSETIEEIKTTLESHEELIEDLQNMKIDKENDDYYPNMSVGTADNLAGQGEATPSEFTSRQSGGGAILDGTARIEAIKGNSVVWNQLLDTSEYMSHQNGIDVTKDDKNNFVVNGATGDSDAWIKCHKGVFTLVQGHKYLVTGCPKGGSGTTYSLIEGNGKIQADFGDGRISECSMSIITVMYIVVRKNTTVANLKYCPLVYDLTTMFGVGNEPATVEEFNKRMPIEVNPMVYNEGQMINLNPSGIKSYSADEEPIERFQDLSLIGTLFPDGMKSVGEFHDEIRYNKETQKWEKVKYIETRPYQEGDEGSPECVTDGEITNYALNGPMIEELDEDFALNTGLNIDFNLDYEVWNGGIEELVADNPTTPLKADIVYGFNAYGKIKELEDRIDNLGTGGGGSNIKVDAELSDTSENPVQNKAIVAALATKTNESDVNRLIGLEHVYFLYKADENRIYFRGFNIQEWNLVLPYILNVTFGKPLTPHLSIATNDGTTNISTNDFEIDTSNGGIKMTWSYNGKKFSLVFDESGEQIITSQDIDYATTQQLTKLSAEVGKKVDADFVNNAIAEAIGEAIDGGY